METLLAAALTTAGALMIALITGAFKYAEFKARNRRQVQTSAEVAQEKEADKARVILDKLEAKSEVERQRLLTLRDEVIDDLKAQVTAMKGQVVELTGQVKELTEQVKGLTAELALARAGGAPS